MKKKILLENLEKEVSAKLEVLRDYVEGPLFLTHEYPPSDPEFQKRLMPLYRLAYELKIANDVLRFSWRIKCQK